MKTRIVGMALVLVVAANAPAQEKEPKLTPKQRSASKLAVKASELLQKQDWDGGIRLCDSALRLDPDNTSARWMRGLAHLKKNDPDQAIADFSNAIKRDARMAPSYRDRGIAYVEKKEYDKALADFNAYLKLRPEDPDGYHERGLAYQAKGSKDKAEADFRKAKELREGEDQEGVNKKRPEVIALPWLLLAGGIVIVIVGFLLASLPGQSGEDRRRIHPGMRDKDIIQDLNRQERMPISSLVIGLGFLCILVSVVWRIVRWVVSVP